MKLILLPGLDGTGKLFEPFIKALPKSMETQVLISLVENEFPEIEKFVLLAESLGLNR